MLLSELEREFIKYCRLRCLSDKTIQGYTENIDRFLTFYDVELEQFDVEYIEKYTFVLLGQRLSNNTVRTYLRELKVFLSWIDKKYKKDYASSIVFPRSHAKLVDIYTVQEIQKLYDYMNQTLFRERNVLILSLMLDCGLRLSEVINLEMASINYEKRLLKITGKGNKQRWVPFGKTVHIQLMQYLSVRKGESNFVFLQKNGSQIGLDTMKNLFRKMQRKTGINVSAHKLRHNFATNYLRHQLLTTGSTDLYQLQTIMGHADSETTKIYLHMAKDIIALSSHYSFVDENM